MGELIDKTHNKVDEVTGAIREKAGEALGDDEMKAEGERDQAGADVKQAGEKVKDVFRH